MRVFMAVNNILELGARQTTTLLVSALVRQGQEVWLASPEQFSISAGEHERKLSVYGVRVPCRCNTAEQVVSVARAADGQEQPLLTDDLIFIRTNPGREVGRTAMHGTFLHLCQLAEDYGLHVVNSPRDLPFFASKSSLMALSSEFRPPMIVTSRLDLVCDFVRNAPGDCVIKPVVGSRGRDVIRVANNSSRLSRRIHEVFGESTVVAQHFVPSTHLGDRRVVTVGGEILEVRGHVGGIERRPAANEFRANLHTGGTAHPLELSESARRAVNHAADILAAHNIWLAGVDLIGDQIIELNVFSTGGLYDASRFANVDFADEVVQRLIAHVAPQAEY